MQKLKFIAILMLLMPSLLFASEWKQVANEDGIVVTAKSTASGTIPFKAKGIINTSLEQVLAVLKDYQKKPKWSPKLKSVKMHKAMPQKDRFIFSEYYKTPWPAYDREFLLEGTIKEINNDSIVLLANSIENEKLENDDHIQAEVKALNVTLKRVSDKRTEITFEFHGDMKGWMPIWLMNLIQKKWPLRFIQGLRKYLLKETPQP